MTTTVTAFDATKPASTQTGTAFAGSANANDVALWYDAIMGAAVVPGFTLTVSGGTAEEPALYYLKNGATWIRATATWSSAKLTQIVWDVSTDSGST